MKVLLTGSTGQLGISIINTKSKNVDLITTKRSELDLSDPASCENYVLNERPDWIINCAAYTSVDKAEKDIDLARSINSYAPEAFAKAINKTNGNLLHISTDFVFDGEQDYPYQTGQKTNPLNQYGCSKALGEELILKKVKHKNKVNIVRTSWIMSPYGKNFILTMLKLHEQKESIDVVCDQVGAPTCAKNLAQLCWKIINFKKQKQLPEIIHWSDAGVASWYDLAVAVGDIGHDLGILKKKAFVNPVKTINYPSTTKRPKYSLLDSQKTCDILEVKPNHWRVNLLEILIEFRNNKKYNESF